MTCLFGKAVSIAGGAGSGVAFAAGRHDDRMGIQLLSVGQRYTLHPFFADKQRVGTAVDQPTAQLMGFVHQRLHNVCRAVGHRKDPGSPRSTLSGTPHSSKKPITSYGFRAFRQLYKKRGLLSTLGMNSSMVQQLVTLQRPFPVISSLRRGGPSFPAG